MKIKELLNKLKYYNPELEVEVMYPTKNNMERLSLKKSGLFANEKGVYYLELDHSENGWFNLIEETDESLGIKEGKTE